MKYKLTKTEPLFRYEIGYGYQPIGPDELDKYVKVDFTTEEPEIDPDLVIETEPVRVHELTGKSRHARTDGTEMKMGVDPANGAKDVTAHSVWDLATKTLFPLPGPPVLSFGPYDYQGE